MTFRITNHQKRVPDFPENKPPILKAHGIQFGKFVQIKAHGSTKIHSYLSYVNNNLNGFYFI